LEWQELLHFFHPRILSRRNQRAAFGCQLGNALGQRLDLLPLLAETVTEARRERGAIPQAEILQLLRKGHAGGPHPAVRREQPLDRLMLRVRSRFVVVKARWS
jgi:hypothetical protein